MDTVAHNSNNQSQANTIPPLYSVEDMSIDDVRDMNTGELVALQASLADLQEGVATELCRTLAETVELELLNREADLALDRLYS